jgi:two-component system NtrC family sensor kinase
MRATRWTHSLKSRIIVSYSLILILGGLSTSAIGIYVTGRALLEQAKRQMVYGLLAAHTIYDHRLQELRQTVELLASSGRLESTLAAGRPEATARYLAGIRQENRMDFLSVTDAEGNVLVRTSGPGTTGDTVKDIGPIARALSGRSAASTEVVLLEVLSREDPALADRAAIEVVPTPKARPGNRQTLSAGMVLIAAAPAIDKDGRITSVVYAGQLLADPEREFGVDGSHGIVEKVSRTLSQEESGRSQYRLAATVFQDDVRITTTVSADDGRRAVGTQVSAPVYDAVVSGGAPWFGRSFAVNDWYITACEPINNLAGEPIGILGVGLLERPYTAVRDQVTLYFAVIALFCFLLIMVVTYFLTRSLMRPLEEMVSVSQNIAAGDLSRRVDITDQSEFGLLSSSFNDMLDRISEMKSQLEQWGKTLEQKVEERTQQLVTVQTQAARQQRLASVGQLAAGVAHEINNPLGGILTFASLVLEELPEDSELREDMNEIVQQAIRCRKIVAELLEFSREREAHMALANINDVVSRTLALLEKQALFHDIKVTREFDADMPMTVMDESQMQQVFMNIILNAVHAMNERGDLTIRTTSDRTRKLVHVSVTDTGCGIPQEHLEAIFDPFFTTKDPGQGTGLGLAVACRIVQAHGGRTDVVSKVGEGTTFTVTLPLITTTDDGAESASPYQRATDASAARG